MASNNNEFRKRGSAHSHSSSSGSLPRPGFAPPAPPPRPSPRPSPVGARRAYSGSGMTAPAPFPTQQQAGPLPSQTGMSHRSNYAANANAYNPNNNHYGGYGGGSSGVGSSNGYNNGLSSSSHLSRSLGSDDKYAKKKKQSGGGGGVIVVVGGILMFVYSILMTTLFLSKNGSMKNLLEKLNQPDAIAVIKTVENLKLNLKNADKSRRAADKTARNKVAGEINRLERENRIISEKHEELAAEALPEAVEKIEKHEEKQDAYQNQVGWLVDRTRRESKRMILERFGPGPHKVRITYQVSEPTDENSEEKKRMSFDIDLAPIELVPHAVQLFLEQVDHGLLEGTFFYLNGPHIVQSGPQPDWNALEGNDDVFVKDTDANGKAGISGGALDTIEKFERQAAGRKVTVYDDDEWESYYTAEDYWEEDKRTKKFQDLGLDQLAFPDYSPEYPHIPWTVGYTGRPGGPDWYINKVDNTEGHGPGGQAQHELEEQGDSCFGTVSRAGEGRDRIAKYIYGSKIYGDNSEWNHFIANPIEIVYAEILTKQPILDRHLHLDHLHSQHKVYDSRRKKDEQQKDTTKQKDAIKNQRNGRRMPHMHDSAQA